MSAGGSAAGKAQSLTEAEQRLRERADRLARMADAYAKGDEGERLLAQHLAPLAADGWFQLPDRCIPGKESNIDCVLVGPGGVLVIDAKNWSGKVTVEGRVLRQNGRRRAEEMERLRVQAATVAEVLDEARPNDPAVPIRPVLSFVGSATIGTRTPIDRVHLLDGGELVGFARSLELVLSQDEVEQVVRALIDGLAPRTSTREHAGDSGRAEPPPEPIVFLTPWRRHGQQRLYVKDELGLDGGYLDLRSGEVQGTSEAANSVLRRLLTHYAAERAPGGLDEEAMGAIKRFLASILGSKPVRASDQPLVAGYLWRNYGRSRLYVHRLEGTGTKVDLGWYDLKERRVHADVAGTEPVIRYCGERYLALEESRSASRNGGNGRA